MATIGVGAAMAGLRPVVEIMFAGLMPLAAEALLNQAAKTYYRTGGQWSVPSWCVPGVGRLLVERPFQQKRT